MIINDSYKKKINEDSYDPYDGKKYFTSKGTSNDPKVAIEDWFKLGSSSSPIMAKHKDDAIQLIKYAHDNIDWFKNLYNQYNPPYKLDYLIDEINTQYSNGCRSFYDGPYDLGDQVHPFSVG